MHLRAEEPRRSRGRDAAGVGRAASVVVRGLPSTAGGDARHECRRPRCRDAGAVAPFLGSSVRARQRGGRVGRDAASCVDRRDGVGAVGGALVSASSAGARRRGLALARPATHGSASIRPVSLSLGGDAGASPDVLGDSNGTDDVSLTLVAALSADMDPDAARRGRPGGGKCRARGHTPERRRTARAPGGC